MTTFIAVLYLGMLLHRFPIEVAPELPKCSETISIMVSFYRKSVDPVYQSMVVKKVAQGELDDYIHMILSTVLKSRT